MIKKEKYSIPKDKSKLFTENIERKKMNEASINPVRIKDDFNIQASKTFNKAQTWQLWYQELKKFLYENTNLLDNWTPAIEDEFHEFYLLDMTVNQSYELYMKNNRAKKRPSF